MILTSDFDYHLPQELIAQSPLEQRESCKMLYLNQTNQEIKDKQFFEIIDFLNKDDILILNDTKVYPARLIAKRKSGAKVEIFLLNPIDNSNRWEALTKNASRVKEGEILEIADDFKVELVKKNKAENENEIPKYVVQLIYRDENIYDVLNKYGSIPLPPYIQRETNSKDNNDYQTVFAKNIGSVACPTAGLHFSKDF